MAKLNREQAFALAGERDWQDPLKEYAQGANTFLSSALGSLDNSIVGDVLRAVKGKPFRQQVEMVLSHPDISQEEKDRIASEYLNADTILQQGQEALKDYSQFWAKSKSKKAQAADKYVAEAEGDNELEKGLNTIGRYIENPATIANQSVGQLPQLLAPAGLAVGLRTKAAQALLQKAGVSTNAATGLGSLGYQVNVGGQQAREQSLEDSDENRPLGEEERKAFDDENYIIDQSKINKNAGESNRYSAAKIATDKASKISAAAGLIGLKSDLALTNLLMGESIKGLSKKGLKAAAGHLAKNIAEETIDEAGSPIGANIGAQQTYDPKRDTFENVGRQAAAGAILGAGMGSVQAGGLYLFGDGDKNEAPTTGDLAQSILNSVPKQDIPKQYQNAFNAFEDAKQAEAQAQAEYEANPTPESEEALAQATDARLKANNQFTQYDAAFKQTFTEQEQKDLLSNDLKGIAARAKLAEEAKQAELNSKAEQEALAKAQRANMVKGLAAYADNEEVLLNEVNQLGLDDTQKELLLREVYAERKNAKGKPQQTQAKTPLELAVDEHFDAKGNRKPSVMSSDVADKHKVSLNELLPAIAKRSNDIKIQKAQAEKQAKQQAQLNEDAKAFQQSQAKLEADAKRKAQAQQKAKEQGLKQDALTEQQQLENILADFAAENDTDSMLSMLEGYDKTEADKLFNNAFKTVETRAKEAEKAVKAKEAEAAKQAQAKQKQSAFNADMAALYESNPNATYNDWKAIGKKYGVTSAIDLANAWSDTKTNAAKTTKQTNVKQSESLALPSPNNVMVTDAQGNTIQTTENNVPKKQRNADISVPKGLNVDVSNAANTQRDRGVGSYSGQAYSNPIVRSDGKPFETEQKAAQALKNRAKKPRKPKEQTISESTHQVTPIDGGYAIVPKVEIEQQATTQEPVVEQSVEDITGEYTHSQIPDATATVTKTDNGYDIDWGDEVESFTGKNAAIKAKASLIKEKFNKKKPKQDGDGGVTVEPAPNKPVSPTNTTQTTPKTTGEQIAEAMDKTAKAITDAAHNKVVERVKNGEEIVYKQSAAIERVKQDDRYQVEINDKGHAVVKNVKDNNGNWVKQEEKTEENNSEVERIASLYAAELGHPVSKRSREFANDILNKNAYGLEFLANGMNDKGKKVFTEVTGISLPKQQGATWKVIRDWAGVSDEQENHRVAMRDVAYAVKAFMRDNNVSQDVADKNKELIASKIAEGFNSIEKIGNNYWFTDGKGQGINLSEKPKKGYLGLSKSRALIEAMIAEAKAAKAILPVEEKGRVASIYRGTPEEQSKFSSVERVLKTNPATGRAVPLQKVDLSNKRTSHLFDLALDVFGGKPDKNSGIKDSSDIIAINPDKDSLIAYDKDGRLKFFMLSTDSKTWNYMGDVASKPDVSNPSIQAAQRVENQPEIKGEAVHVEDGKIEEVTGEIIRESIAKVDDKPINGRTMSLKEAKQWLLDSIDKAIATAKYKTNIDVFGRNGEKNPKSTDYITFDVPNDGKFKVLNTIESLQKFKDKVQKTKGFTENQKPVKSFSAPSENSPENTISNFLADGELENAYFFAENQDKPIKFTLSEKGEPIAYFLTEPVDLGNGIKGFVGLASNGVNKEGRKNWLVIEEKSRKAIGFFGGASKQAAIKSAKERLSALKKEDLESLASKIKPIGKTDEEMKADWLAKNNIKIDEQSNEEVSTKKSAEDLAKAKAQAAPTRGEREAEKAKQDGRITPDIAGNMKNGDIVRTKDGKEYLSLGARHDWLEVAPIINGKSQVNNESTFKFLLSPEKASAYPERRNEPVYLTGRNYYDEQRNKEVSTKKSAEDLAKAKAQAAPTRGEREAEKEKTKQSDNQKLKSILDDLLSLRDAKKETSVFIADDGKKYNKVQKSVSGRLSKKQYEEIRDIVGLQNSITIENTETKNSGINLTAKTTSEYGSFYAFSTEYILADNVNDSKTKASIIKVDFPLEETINAWQHSVRNPREVAKSFKRTFEDFIEEAYNSALSQAETDLQKKALEQASLKLQQDYIKRFNELNAARSGVVSSFIAGRNNFNGKQAESRGNSFDKVSQRFDNWLLESKYELSTAVQDARSPEQLAKIKAEKEAKAQRLQDKNDEFLRKVLSFKKGDDFTIGKNKVVRVNTNKYGMPISLTLEGAVITKGLDDKISLYGRGMAYPTINDLREAVARVQKKDESELIPKKSDNEDLAPVEKAQPQVEANKLIDEDKSEYNGFTDNMSAKEAGRVKSVLSVTFDYGDLGVLSRSELIEQFAKQGVFSESNTEIQRIKAKEDHPDAYFTSAGYLRDKYVDVLSLGGFTITKTEHEYSQYLFEKNKEKESLPIKIVKSVDAKSEQVQDKSVQNNEPTPVKQPEAKTEEKPAEKPSISDKQANREKIRITMLQATNREKALALAVKLTEEMPDMDYEITSELQSVIQHNKWLGIEIKMPKTPFKGDSDAEVKKSITQLKKAFDGTGYSFNLIGLDKNSVMGQLSFSKDFSTRLNYIRNSKDIWVLFDNNYSNAGSLEFLDPVAKAITKWLNGENVEPFMAGIDPNWDIQFRSIPRVIADKLSAAKEKGENSTSKASTLTESKTINDSKKEDSIQPTSKTPLLDKNNSFMDLVRDGKATAEEFKQSFDDLFANKEAVIAELNTLTKDQLFKEGSYNIQYRYKNDKKSVIAEAVYHEMIARYSLGRDISYGMGKNSYENAVKKMVDDTDQARLDDFAKEYKQMIDDRAKEITERAEALKNPQTLEDYRNLVRSKMADGSTRQEAFLSLTPEQRIKYDELEAESTKETREAKKRALQSTVNTASQTTTGTIIETKHTRDGYDLFVVQLSDRLSTDDYKQVLSEAKRLGGWYSSFRGNGAIAGFQFKDKGSAEAFLALAGGDTTAAKEQIDAKIDAFEDNRSQTAVERLQAMADKLEEKANEELSRDRLANTARRARFAASAEFAARSQIALAKTMRNIADAISSGKAKFLDNIRMKTDVEALQNYIASAKDSEIRAKYKTYAEQEKRKGQPATVETADFATYPSYTLYRSDLAMLGRKLLEIEGLKKFGQQIMAVADDVSDAYLEFAKKNLHQVSRFSKGDSSLATFSSKDIAERSIRKSGLTGKAIVLQVKRGENIIILSPSEAINLKVWEGDADKRITLKREFGNDLVNAVGRRAGKNNNLLPYQFQLNYDKFKSLSRMGIETPSEFRSALREFIALQEEATNNKVREMELAMVGRKNDGLDFFPTPQVITQQMIEAAEITPDMAVLEPSAGMGHIADMIRATGAEPDVIEMSGERRELLKEKGYHLAETNDFMDMQPRKFFTYGDVFRAPDGKEGVMRGSSGQRVMLLDSEGNSIGYYNRDELEGVRHQGVDSGYDRIIMNPPFSNRQDAEHVRHAYDLLKPNGRIVAIMGEGVFFGSDKKAVEFREWLDSVGGTSEKLPDNSFMDKSLPVNTGVNARMVVIDKQESNNQDTDNKPKFSQSSAVGDRTITQVREKLVKHFGEKIISLLEKKGILKIHQSLNDESVPNSVKNGGSNTDGAYDEGVIHLIADNLTDETIIPTFVHELGVHKGFQEMMSPKAYELIMQQFNRLVAQGNSIAIKAKQRAEEAESLTDEDKQGKTPQQILDMEKEALARQKDEYLPYLITEQAKVQQATPQQRNAVQRLIDHIVRAVKGWVVRHLSKYDTTYNMSRRVSESLTPADILYMAERMVGDIAKYSGDNNRPKLSRTEQSQFDQLLAKADKMIAEQGKLLAPNGKPSKLNRVQWAQVRTDNFKNWFGDWENDPENSSKVIDENGEPLVVYHGSRTQNITEFYTWTSGIFGAGTYFTIRKHEAHGYSNDGVVYEAFINARKPLRVSEKAYNQSYFRPASQDEIIRLGYDSTITTTGINHNIDYVIAISPTQIKSAIGNNGDFSPTNPDIRFSRAEDKAKAAKDYVLDSVRISNEAKANLHAKAELGWWSKTFGTQLNTAKKFKDFDRVYKTLQRLLQHTSSDVMDALEVAPTLLEKLDSLSDLKEQWKSIGRNIAQYARKVRTGEMTDREAVAKVIFRETLAKEALSQADLEQKLTPQQLKIYEEAREAINVSLKNTAKSEIIRSLLQNDVINFDTVEKLLNQQTGFDEFIDEMLENVGARISNAQEELSQAETDAEKQAIKDELKRLADMYNSISDVNTKVFKLIDEAYAPLMRFGDYALTMRDKTTGKVLSFMMFESKAERNRMVNYLGREYGDTVTLETDTMSTEEFKQFKGITPESLALFAKEIGLSQDEATQAYLKLAIPATSALTRRIHRKGTEGYNEDIQRVLASFVMSNARYSAKNIYLAKVNEAINDIESGKSIKDQAIKMRDNTINPADTSAWLRDLLFVWNLGGSVMFAFLNMTQPFMQTLPMLSQYVNTGFATKHILRGIKVAGAAMTTGNAPKGYEAEYKRAVQEGIVDPQNTFMLTGLERGGTGTTSKTWTATKHLLGIFAQVSESLNRKAVFVASLEVAKAKGDTWLKQKGFDSAYDFAVDVIAQTQGVYNKANRSNWAHSQLGAPLLVFKQFSINYVEQMIRMWKNQNAGEEGKKAVFLAMMMLFSLAGGMGLPFIKDIFDGSETIAAFMGNPVNIEREMRLMGKKYLGETTTGALMDGWFNKLVIGEVLGADVQSRTGMGDLIPMTNTLNPVLSTSQRTNEAMSIFGAAGGLGEKVGDSIQLAANDNWGDAFVTVLPRFATSMYRGAEMMTTGETTDSKGRRLFDTTFGEGLVKFLDSQPVRMAELSRARGLEYDDIAIQRSKIDYYRKKWIKAAQKEDMEAIEEIEQDIEDWNEENEKYPVIFDRQRALKSANKNEMTWGEREERTPKGMDWLKDERPDWLNEQ